MYKKKKLVTMSDLADDVLARHGIKRQVMTAMLVKKSNELLQSLLQDHAKNDIRAISYHQDVLTIGCKHSAAIHEFNRVAPMLEERLKIEFPNINIHKISHKIHPDLLQYNQ
jgi:hypothetical protein